METYNQAKFELEQLISKMCIDKRGLCYTVLRFKVEDKTTNMVEIKKGWLRKKVIEVDAGYPEYISSVTTKNAKQVETDWVNESIYQVDDLYYLLGFVNNIKVDRERYVRIKNGLNSFGVEIKKIEI